MGNFLKTINEAIPTGQGPATGKIETGEGLTADQPADAVKKGGFLNKVASVAQKSANFIQKGAEVARGNWDINNVLQGILDKQLDSSTSKVGSFGRPNFNKIKLGDDIVKKINAYGQDVKTEPAAVEANESFGRVFLAKVDEAITVFEKSGSPKKLSKAQQEARMKPIGDKISAKARLLPIVSKLLGKEKAEYNTLYITKNFNKILLAIQKMYGPESEYAKDEEAKPLDFTFELPGAGRVAKKKEEVKESTIALSLREAVSDDIVKELGRDGSLELLQGFEKTYPGKQIKFKEVETPEGGPVIKLTVDNAIFELAGRTSFGEKGVQFTLKPISTDIISILKDRDIKYLTYLLQSKDNEFKTAEGNSGIIYAYDESNQPINEITSEGVNFQWDGQGKVYTLSTDNKELMGVKYSEGQYPINKSDVKPLTDGKHILMRPDEKSGYMKFAILQDLPTTKQFLINFKKGVTATPEEVKEAEELADPSPVRKTS